MVYGLLSVCIEVSTTPQKHQPLFCDKSLPPKSGSSPSPLLPLNLGAVQVPSLGNSPLYIGSPQFDLSIGS